MNQIELLIGLLVVVAALAWLASRVNISYPILLVLGGLGIAMVPGLPRVELQPDLVFLLFLPPLLYYAGLQTSWRDFKSNIRPISFLAVGLVLFTTCLVAIVAHELAGVSWAAAFALGAIVSPPDAIAATAIAQRLRVPRRIVHILEGESLVNDAGALVVYRIAIAVALGHESFSFGTAAGRFLLIGAAGVVVGYAAGMLVAWVRPRVKDPAVESSISLLTPYVAYLPAEWLHVSGVLAVVTCGIYLSRRLPLVVSPRARLRAYATWETVVFLLNGIVFILIGLQLPAILETLAHTPARTLVLYAAVVSGVVIVARLLWVVCATAMAKIARRGTRNGMTPPSWRAMFVIGWTGMRGIVSLAAAMALPREFPHRELILFITFGVILATLVVQGLTVPLVIRAARLPDERDGDDEETTARYLGALAAVERLDRLAAGPAGTVGLSADQQAPVIARLRAEYDERIAYYSQRLAPPTTDVTGGDDGLATSTAACEVNVNYRMEALNAERQMVLRLRDQGVIGDEVLRAVQEDLDLEASRLSD